MPYLQRKAADTLIGSGTQAPDTGLHRKEQAAPIDSVQELRLLRDGTHCIRCQCTFSPPFLSISDSPPNCSALKHRRKSARLDPQPGL